MNMGILPTKGLTLPFYSFGGSAMLVSLAMIGYILKVDAESVGMKTWQQPFLLNVVIKLASLVCEICKVCESWVVKHSPTFYLVCDWVGKA
ncbi:cell division protein FtsW [Moraxella caviae]|nr:cell division protein FtsW [Moraxella caviae]